ncbi:PucR family transcriptional regulator [Acetonema longum]|uniref:Transcriptional regulator n=1 Tax=Acetonema longum DSM 6540 TaxID=1009370 RepID=F7NFC2_9FIRM|nr:PucR family transcriptional regulator [Acetonema longum]EGO65247.1 transcriptional regulator [Acetonema longum DSM 6540]
MSITVRDALLIGGLQHSRLIGGKDGLDRKIGCVDILEVPDASLWLREHELLVTTCYAVRNDPEEQLNILRAMARSGSAALAVKFGRFVGSPPPEMMKLADELAIPLLDVPDGVSFLDITHPVMTAIVNRQAEKLAYSEKVHRRLTQLALEQHGLPPVAVELAQLLERPVMMADDSFKLIAASDATSEAWGAGISVKLKKQPDSYYVQTAGICCDVFPVDVQTRRYGYILVVRPAEPDMLTDMQNVAVEHAVTVAALQLAREEAVREARHSTNRDFLEDLIAGAIPNREMAITRGEAMGLRLDEPYYIMVADIDGFTGVLAKQQKSECMARQMKGELLRLVEQAAAVWQRRTMIVSRSDSVVIILSVGQKGSCDWRKRLAAFADGIQGRVRQRWSEITLTIGISRLGSDILDFSGNYHHVRDMIRIVRKLYGRGRTVFWDDMEIYNLLSGDRKQLEIFYRGTLGGIDRPDIKNRQDLLETLEIYLECQGNVVAAAEKLFIHRNTLRYRLERLQELLGRDWDNPDYRFTLWMALKARNLLQK